MMSSKMGNDTSTSHGAQAESDLFDQADTESNPTAVDSFAQAVDKSKSAVLANKTVDERLTQLKAAMANQNGWDRDDWADLIDGLTQYSFQVVRSWLAIIAVGDGDEQAQQEPFRLVGADVDQLAESIVSRAENGFRAELARIRWWLDGDVPDMKLLHLVECALQLPDAYRNWQLSHHRTVAEDALEDLAMAHGESGEPVQQLYRYLTEDRDRVAHLLQTQLYSDVESAEIIDATLAAYELLARKGGSR